MEFTVAMLTFKKIYYKVALRVIISKKAGFTLMEILIAIAILAVIATGLLGNFMNSLKKGRDAQRKSDLRQLQNALEAYANDHNGLYPDADANGLIHACPATTGTSGWPCTWDDPSAEIRQQDGSIYMKNLVSDPMPPKQYFYAHTTGNLGYKLYACLENADDPEATDYSGRNCGGGCQYRDAGGSLVNTGCNYGVASTNETP